MVHCARRSKNAVGTVYVMFMHEMIWGRRKREIYSSCPPAVAPPLAALPERRRLVDLPLANAEVSGAVAETLLLRNTCQLKDL